MEAVETASLLLRTASFGLVMCRDTCRFFLFLASVSGKIHSRVGCETPPNLAQAVYTG